VEDVRRARGPVEVLRAFCFGAVVVDPHTPSTLYLVGQDILRSKDGGATWDQILGRHGSGCIHGCVLLLPGG